LVTQVARAIGLKLGLPKLLGRKEDEVAEIAKVLAGMMLVGVEKRARCIHYDPSTGLCRFLRIAYPLPWMSVDKDGDEYRIRVSKHPEICSVCPFWKPIDGDEE